MSKLIKINIAFKCPMENCMVGGYTNGTECLRCVLLNIIGDQKIYDEVQRSLRVVEGVTDITAENVPDNTPVLTEQDLEFLSGPASILMGQKEWQGDALEKAVELYTGSSRFRDPAPVLDITPDVRALPAPTESDE